MGTLANLVKVTTTTTGTVTLTLGSATDGGVTPADAGVVDGQVVSYALKAANGDREASRGVYDSTGPTLTRPGPGIAGWPFESTTGSLLSLTDTTEVMITALAEDFDKPIVQSGGYLMPPNVEGEFEIEEDMIFALPIRYEGVFGLKLNWYCQGGSTGGEVRLGLYSSDAQGMPDALLEGSGALSCDADAEVEYEFAAARFLKGLYYLAFIANAAATGLLGAGCNRQGGVPLPTNSGTDAAWGKAQAYGALPSTFGAPDDDHGVAPLIKLGLPA